MKDYHTLEISEHVFQLSKASGDVRVETKGSGLRFNYRFDYTKETEENSIYLQHKKH